MRHLDGITDRIRTALDLRHCAREETLSLSREVIRSSANAIRCAHRDETERARELLRSARKALDRIAASMRSHPHIHSSGYVHDCQKEYAEAAIFLSVIAGEQIPDPVELSVDYPAYLNGLGEAVGELRRHALDLMRRARLQDAEKVLSVMDEIYSVLVSLDYPDALTGGLRRTTDSVRGIIEKTRGDLTSALGQEELRRALETALGALRAPAPQDGDRRG